MASFVKYQGKQGPRYKAVIRIKGYPTETKTFPTKRLAQQWANGKERDIEEGRVNPDAVGRRMTLNALITEHLKHDIGRDKTKIDRLAWWAKELGDRKLSELSHAALLATRNKLREEKRPGGATRSPATVNRYLANLSAVLRFGVDEGLLVENPVKRIKRAKEGPGRKRWLRDEEREALLASVQHPDAPDWLYPLTIMALGTGARRGELFALTWTDVDLNRGVAHLGQTKNDESRVLALLPPVVNVLRDWKERRTVRRLRRDLVFAAPYTALDKPWGEALARAGIEDFHFHDLRHSCASYLAQAGVPQRTIMEALGHKTLAASQRYMHLDTAHVMTALDRAMEGKL